MAQSIKTLYIRGEKDTLTLILNFLLQKEPLRQLQPNLAKASLGDGSSSFKKIFNDFWLQLQYDMVNKDILNFLIQSAGTKIDLLKIFPFADSQNGMIKDHKLLVSVIFSLYFS